MSEAIESFGRFVGKAHVLPVRIYYEDTDLSGIVYHANYLRFMERGRSPSFSAVPALPGWPRSKAKSPGPGRYARLSLDFMRPARLNDVIDVHTKAVAPPARAD